MQVLIALLGVEMELRVVIVLICALQVIKVCSMDRGVLNITKCGVQSQDRIAYGEIAEVFQFPWMALLGGQNEEFHCGGSLIAESFVLTATHCSRPKVTFVRVGETNLSTSIDCNCFENECEDCAEPHQDIPVARFIRHPKYSISKGYNDIALVKLKHPARLNDNVQPICLPFPEMIPKNFPNFTIVSGWGFTENSTEISNDLRFFSVPIVELEQCQQSLNQKAPNDPRRHVDERQVCAGGDSNRANHCHGDSGGPLQYHGGKRMVIHGVVSWGLSSCGKESVPGVYTKVSYYLDWIVSQANSISETPTKVTLSTVDGESIPESNNVSETLTEITTSTVNEEFVPESSNETLADDLGVPPESESQSNNVSKTSTEFTTFTMDEEFISESDYVTEVVAESLGVRSENESQSNNLTETLDEVTPSTEDGKLTPESNNSSDVLVKGLGSQINIQLILYLLCCTLLVLVLLLALFLFLKGTLTLRSFVPSFSTQESELKQDTTQV